MILGDVSLSIERSHMKANPGGVIDPRDVYGRDGLIAELWQRLDQLCVLMNAERRIGKTSVLRKMASEGAPGWFPVLLDLEKFHSAEEFAVGVYEQVQGYLGIWKKTANAARKVYEDHEFEHFKRTSGRGPWKALLTAAVHDLVSEKQELRPVFLWDQVPYRQFTSYLSRFYKCFRANKLGRRSV
jgi:hypothetical protein